MMILAGPLVLGTAREEEGLFLRDGSRPGIGRDFFATGDGSDRDDSDRDDSDRDDSYRDESDGNDCD